MRKYLSRALAPTAGAIALFAISHAPLLAEDEPTEWIEPATGHTVIQLSTEPGSASFYFHQNAYTANGDKLVFATPAGLSTVNLQTRKIEQIVDGRADQVVVGRNTRQVFYVKERVVYATDIDTRATREIANLPPDFRRGSGLAVNADETLLAGSFVKGGPETNAAPLSEEQSQMLPPDKRPPLARMDGRLELRWPQRLPMALFTINIKSGEIKTFHSSNDWLNHVQFSPTDPTLMMFCHEGPWHKVDRIWTIRTDGTELRKIHTRTMDMEIAGHEFFSADGKTIWFDLQTPKGKEFWLAGVVLATGEKIRYQVPRDQWSVHYNVSRDGKHFSGDGGGPHSVAAPGKWPMAVSFHARKWRAQMRAVGGPGQT